MPQQKSSRRLIRPLLLFTVAGWALWALGRNQPSAASAPVAGPSGEQRSELEAPALALARARTSWSKRRLATSLAFVTLFFGGAAFSAGAGDVVAEALEGASTEVTSTEVEEPASEEPAAEEPASQEPAAEEPASEEPASEDPAVEAPAEDPAAVEEPAVEQTGGQEPASEQPAPELPAESDDHAAAPGKALVGNAPSGPAHLDPEAETEGVAATIWLHRTLPDPTPPAKRLAPKFARQLVTASNRARVDWALVLGVVRAGGHSESRPASRATLRLVAGRLAAAGARRDEWMALLALRGNTAFADRALALTHYNRAVGLNALVTGLQAAKPTLRRRVLNDSRIDIYAGGRLDVAMGRTDVRVLVLMRYLAEAHGQVTVSSLTTGHRLYSRPGVVSAHVYGLAVDIASLGGRSILGNQEPGGLTERAVRTILLLPRELQPRQVISLLGLGGASFPLADHHDHIHVGY